MTQARLVDVPAEPPKLTARQAAVLAALKGAGHEGLGTAEAGAIAHDVTGRHTRGRACAYCHEAGTEVLKALRSKGLARYTLKAGWLATGAPETLPAGMTEEIPY